MNEKKFKRNDRSKKFATRLTRQYILIVCEGEKTEPNYFKCFNIPKNTGQIITVGTGFNTLALVEEAQRIVIDSPPSIEIDYDEAWVVFDKDDFRPSDFNSAIIGCSEMKGKNGKKIQFHAAWSNQSFELWYSLHFKYDETAHHRDNYISFLNSKFNYQKNMKDIRTELGKNGGKEDEAIKRAKKLADNWASRSDYAYHNPCTQVYKLVEKLKSLEEN